MKSSKRMSIARIDYLFKYLDNKKSPLSIKRTEIREKLLMSSFLLDLLHESGDR